MKLANEFVISAGVDRTWELLNDLAQVAPCLPGAAITGRDGEEYLGTVKLKVGPIGAHLKGVARFWETGETARTAVISMSGKDMKGSTATDATMKVRLEPIDDSNTRVYLDTDLEISGRMAQFGRGAIADVSNRLISQFTENLAKLVEVPGRSATSEDRGARQTVRAGDTGGHAQLPSAASPSTNADGDLNLLQVLGPTILRQIGPVVLAIILGFILGRSEERRVGKECRWRRAAYESSA